MDQGRNVQGKEEGGGMENMDQGPGWSREGREGKEGLKEEKNQYDKEWVSYDILMVLPPTI